MNKGERMELLKMVPTLTRDYPSGLTVILLTEPTPDHQRVNVADPDTGNIIISDLPTSSLCDVGGEVVGRRRRPAARKKSGGVKDLYKRR